MEEVKEDFGVEKPTHIIRHDHQPDKKAHCDYRSNMT